MFIPTPSTELLVKPLHTKHDLMDLMTLNTIEA